MYCMVVADGVVAVKELETLYRIGMESYGISPEEINKAIVSSGKSVAIPSQMEEKLEVLYHLAEIAWADGEIDESERRLLARYAVRYGFLEDNAEEIAKYMLEQVHGGKSLEETINSIMND